MSNPGSRRSGSSIKIRLTVLCAKNLAKKDFFRLPDPFAKVVVDGSGQCHSTDTVKSTLDPKWNQHYDLYIGKTDSITISIWNHKKIHKRQGAGFLGCIRLLSNAISRLKDTGYQRLDLCKLNPSDSDAVRGQIVVSLQTRDRIGSGGPVVDCRGLLENEGSEPLLTHSLLLLVLEPAGSRVKPTVCKDTHQWHNCCGRPCLLSRRNISKCSTGPGPPLPPHSHSSSPRLLPITWDQDINKAKLVETHPSRFADDR